MANTMTGRVLKIGEVEEIPSKNGGESFRKRTVILNCTRSDFGRVFNNFPSFEFTGRHIDDPLGFKELWFRKMGSRRSILILFLVTR